MTCRSIVNGTPMSVSSCGAHARRADHQLPGGVGVLEGRVDTNTVPVRFQRVIGSSKVQVGALPE
ncbi:hypothetical protein SALBM311S_01605 [Streptomyces alboniger]